MRTVKFKSSEVGPIPMDWEVKPLGDCCQKIGSGATPTGGASVYLPMGVSLIRSQNVYNDFFKYEGLAHISDKAASDLESVTVCKNDLLLNITGDSVARCTIVPDDVLPARVNQHVAIIRTDSGQIDSRYLQCYLIAPKMQSFMLNEASGQGGSRNALTKGMVAKFEVAIPPRPEQERIAEALSDVDALLSAMTTLIEKKRAIKQGAMQQLLTGKKRLAGFTGPWVETHIGELTDVITGATPSTERPDYWGGDIRWMSSGELNDKIVSEVSGRITKKGFDACSTHMIPVGCVLIGLAGQGKTRGTAAYNLVEMCTNQSIASILPNPYFDSKFLYYYMDRQYDDLRLISAGDGGRGGLTKGQIEKYPVKIPPTISEQKAISEVLSDMDAEIAALEAKRAKYESIKQGMMQELLTGKVRLA